MNDVVYQIACFMVMQRADGLALEPYAAPHRHHHRRPRSEIVATRPPNFVEMFLDFFDISGRLFRTLRSIACHAPAG